MQTRILAMNASSTPTAASTDTIRSLRTIQSSHDRSQYLTVAEADQIHNQFAKTVFRPGSQVMWSGVPREWAQAWAVKNKMQTLTTVMGPLMDKEHPVCLKSKKSVKEWSIYVKGASELYAHYIPKGYVITVLTRPPPQRLNPTGESTYQTIEEPILKGISGGKPVSRIEMVHLAIESAQDFRYQVWPMDEVQEWIEKFGLHPSSKPRSLKIKKSARQVTEPASESRALIQSKALQKKVEVLDSIQVRVEQEGDGARDNGQEIYVSGKIQKKTVTWTRSKQEEAIQEERNEAEVNKRGKTKETKGKEENMESRPLGKVKTRQLLVKEQKKKVVNLEEAVTQMSPFRSEDTQSRMTRTLTLRSRVIVYKY